MGVTIKDVASKAGVSLSTVSLVLNKKKNVSEETRQKVMRVIEALDYHPHRIARGLASKTTGNIGFILTEDHFSRAEPFYTKVFLGTEFEARAHHYYMLLTTVNGSFRKNKHIPRFLLEKNVDGVILAGHIPAVLIEYIRKTKTPFVFVDFLPKTGAVSAVLIDNVDGARQAVSHLTQLGHNRIAFVGGDMDHPSLKVRLEGYKKALLESGISVDENLIVADEPSTAFEDGYNAMCKLLKRGVEFSGLFAGNDAMAQGCLRCMREHDVRVPDDVALVGFDDIENDLMIEPNLTTVHVDKVELGAMAIRRLVEMIKAGHFIQGKTLLPVELVVRRSTGVSIK
ncbi:LacI family DNA-binding transcriptional regulator [candidate division KSB1 bacterium]|nr:LacI family DNA-binding transcriptional regulator [candidate division KSB1 bacterium]